MDEFPFISVSNIFHWSWESSMWPRYAVMHIALRWLSHACESEYIIRSICNDYFSLLFTPINVPYALVYNNINHDYILMFAFSAFAIQKTKLIDDFLLFILYDLQVCFQLCSTFHGDELLWKCVKHALKFLKVASYTTKTY